MKKNYLDRPENKEIRRELAYQTMLYNLRVDRIIPKLIESGDTEAIPLKYNIVELAKVLKSKHQINTFMSYMSNVYVSSLGKKNKDGKYEAVVVGSKGAKILNVEKDYLEKQTENANRRRRKQKEKLKEQGMELHDFELHDFTFDINVAPKTFMEKREQFGTKLLINNYFAYDMELRHESLGKAIDNVFSVGEANLLKTLIGELNDAEIDVFLRDKESRINFDYVYSKLDSDKTHKMVYYLTEYMGKEKMNEILSRNPDWKEYIGSVPRGINVRMERNNVNKAREEYAKIEKIWGQI